MDEAERCSRVGLMYQGKIISEGTPASLRQTVKGDLLAVTASDLPAAETIIKQLDGVAEVQIYGDRLHVFVNDCPECRAQIESALKAGGVRDVEIHAAVPRLEEAFISLVTHQG